MWNRDNKRNRRLRPSNVYWWLNVGGVSATWSSRSGGIDWAAPDWIAPPKNGRQFDCIGVWYVLCSNVWCVASVEARGSYMSSSWDNSAERDDTNIWWCCIYITVVWRLCRRVEKWALPSNWRNWFVVRARKPVALSQWQRQRPSASWGFSSVLPFCTMYDILCCCYGVGRCVVVDPLLVFVGLCFGVCGLQNMQWLPTFVDSTLLFFVSQSEVCCVFCDRVGYITGVDEVIAQSQMWMGDMAHRCCVSLILDGQFECICEHWNVKDYIQILCQVFKFKSIWFRLGTHQKRILLLSTKRWHH